MYQALYRKWRPRTFDDVVGQEHITETLKRQLETGHLSHAYLFTGTRGTGKTTCAKILARAVNCEHPVNGNPCNQCPACLGIESGSILDVLELDAASNNGVDQIRALREEAIYTPSVVRKRVYIVDEVHMLSTAAFNALLKILEEPPEHLMFILATTELHKVLPTIRSRCQQFAFKRIPPAAIVGQLQRVAQAENIALDEPAAELLSRLADGGLRDALSLLDQCSGGERVTEDTVLSVLGLAGNRRTADLLDCIAREDTLGALEKLDGLYRDGKDMGALLGELSTLVRDILIRKTAPEGGRGLLTGGYGGTVLRDFVQKFSSGELVQMLKLLQGAQADLYRSTSRRMDAELCLIRLCDRRLSDTPEGLLGRITRLEEQIAGGVLPVRVKPPEDPVPLEVTKPLEAVKQPEVTKPPETVSQPEATKLPEMAKPPETARQPEVTDSPEAPKPSEVPAPAEAPVSSPGGKSWNGFLSHLGGLPPLTQKFLRNPVNATGGFEGSGLTIWLDSDFGKGILSKGNTVALLEQAAQGYTGQACRVVLKVGKPPERKDMVSPAPAEDKFNDLLAIGRQFGNFTVK